jgi:nucleotide-binding universal stress UspA family protein
MRKLSIRNVLVPIDFSHMSIQAIDAAKGLAHRFGATVHLAHVHGSDYPAAFTAPMPPFQSFSAVNYQQEIEQNVAHQLSDLAKEYRLASANCHVRTGGPAFDEICGLAQEISAGLIVTPTHGRTGLKHVFLGSTAERIVQHSPCPVFVVRQKKRKSETGRTFTAHTILVPVDFSDCSREGLQYAIGFANEFGAKIVLLHATYLGYVYASEGTAIYDVRALQEAARKNAERQMRELVRKVKFGRVKFETFLTNSSPVLDVCAFARDHNVDLIITSTHGQTGWKHMLVGSIAEHVVRYAPCPVLVVPSHPDVRVARIVRKPERVRKRARRLTKKSKSQRRISKYTSFC